MNFSHHSSNPLEARESDPTNQKYHHILQEIDQSQSSGDELDQLSYQRHVQDVVGDRTPQAGPSRRYAATSHKSDVEMQSEDPLAQPYHEEIVVSPRKGKGRDPSNEGGQKYLTNLVIPPFKGKVDPQQEQEPVEDQELGEEQELGLDDWGDEHYVNAGEDEEMAEDDNEDENRSRSSSPLTPLSYSDSEPYSSPQSSRPSSPDEATTLQNRPAEEQEEIEEEITKLYDAVPYLKDKYDLIDRLGTGTFSSVYKAIDTHYNEWYNTTWLGHHPPESTAYYQSAGPGYKGRGGRAARWRQLTGGMDIDSNGNEDDEKVPDKVFVAIKRIYTTSGPERIRNELAILEECRSCRHTSQIITAFRNEDQVVIVLPYQRNKDFREFYQDLHPEGIKCYFRCLFRALRDIHARGIIHRDVKPANFLYDPFTGVGTLCDFGLASRMEEGSPLGKCHHTPASRKDPHGKISTLIEGQADEIKRAQRDARSKSASVPEKVGYPEQDRRPVSKANRAGTRGFRAPEVLLKCGAQTGAIDVWSAGVILLFFLTGKFPIFQSNDDIEGLMEIAVIIGKKKLEKAATLHGRTIATNVPDLDQDGVTWQEFVEKLNPDIKEPRKYDMRYYPHNSKHRDGRGSALPPPPPLSSSPTLINGSDSTSANHSSMDTAQQQSDRHANPPSSERHAKEIKVAFHFLELVLHCESTKRATPQRALYHKFLEEAGAPPDDDVVPHLMGEGVCGDYHGMLNGVECVTVYRKCSCRGRKVHSNHSNDWESEKEEIDLDSDSDGKDADEEVGDGHQCDRVYEQLIELAPGEGIAIGKQPCEFHKDMMNTNWEV